jgi:hypothetical protein
VEDDYAVRSMGMQRQLLSAIVDDYTLYRKSGKINNNNRQSEKKADNPSTPGTVCNPSAENSNATIVVQLSGEMGNNLQKIAFGRGLQLLAKERGIQTNLVFRRQESTSNKWKTARIFIKKCFPNLRQFDFEAGNGQEYQERVIEQKMLSGLQLNIQDNDDDTITSVLDNLQHLVNQRSHIKNPPTINNNMTNIRIPFVYANKFVGYNFLDRFKDDFRQFFAFDEEACCARRPEPDENVFHFRNFRHELMGATDNLGFTELGPQQTARELFGHLSPGDKVAVLSRFKNNDVQKYIEALEARGVQVRLISGQTPFQDFCFLKSTERELVGSEISTFFQWAAYLGDSEVRSYFVQSNERAGKSSGYEWQDPILKERYRYEFYLDKTTPTV